jgi:hypothetical protein
MKVTTTKYRPIVKRLAAKHGLEIEIEGYDRMGSMYTIEALAPHGYSFEQDELHFIYGIGERAADAWCDLYDRLEGYLPLEECTKECDCYCVEDRNPDGSWARPGYPYRQATDEEYEAQRAEWRIKQCEPSQ